MPKKTFVLSLGGSVFVPDAIDTTFLKKFKSFIITEIKKGNRFVIVSGGGATARKYRDAGAAVVQTMPIEDLDWLGIHATRLNAQLLRTIFRGIAYQKVIKDPTKKHKIKADLIIAAGFRPGNSTDYCAVMIAKNYGASTVINLSNIDYVYTKDPKLAGAKKIEQISWADFRKIVGNKWDPGLHAPFDPIASKHAQQNNLRVIVANGKDFKNLEKIISGKKFKGTIIH